MASLSGKWMGLGDAKLLLGIGWMLSPAAAVSSVFFAFWAGALVGISLMFSGRIKGLKSEMPFAPFLALGALLSFFFQLNFLYIVF